MPLSTMKHDSSALHF